MKLSDLYNPLMRWLLSSPLHSLISKDIVLLTFAGRKSGKQYTTPINYVRDGDTLTLITNRKHGWWRNLRGGVPVTVRVRGEDRQGVGRAVEADAETALSAMLAVYRGIPSEQARRLAPDVVIISIQLDGERAEAGRITPLGVGKNV